MVVGAAIEIQKKSDRIKQPIAFQLCQCIISLVECFMVNLLAIKQKYMYKKIKKTIKNEERILRNHRP